MSDPAEERDVDEVVDELMERAEEIGREFRGGGPPTYPPGVDPVRLRALMRAGLRESIVKARGIRNLRRR